MVHPQISNVATDLVELMARFEKYAETYIALSLKSNSKFVILLGVDEFEFKRLNSDKFPNLEIIRISRPTWNFVFFGIRARYRLLKLGVTPAPLIAGDLGVGFISVVFMSLFSKARIPLQISIHGLPSFAKEYSRIGFKLTIKRIALKLLISRADSIRVVSKFLQKNIAKNFNIDEKRFTIAPVPIVHLPNFERRKSSNLTVGIVGRLHYERNLIEAMQIVDNIVANSKIDKVIFIGDGPLRPFLNAWLSHHSYQSKIHAFGKLTQQEMQLHWGNIDVLISCAVSEGYGLALREAIVSGAIAVARENPGTLELQEIFPNSVYLYTTVPQAVTAIEDASSRFNRISKENTFDVQQDLDLQSISRLAQSWLDA